MSTSGTGSGPGAESRTTPSQSSSDAGRFTEDALDRRPVRPSRWKLDLGILAAVALFLLAFSATGIDMRGLGQIPGNIWNYSQLMVSGVFQPLTPDVREAWREAFDAMLESIQIAWIGTVIGAIFSLPVGVLAARNLSPIPIYAAVRFVLSGLRAIPDIVIAIAIMMPIFGIGTVGGALTGAMAIGISSIGTLSKLISETIESTDTGPMEAARAAGASPFQVIRWAILPQVLPDVIAIWLYRFEVNIRASAILGVLGIGGIGTLLSTLFGLRHWESIGITLVVICVVTIIVDQMSGWVRHRVIYGVPRKGADGRDSPKPTQDSAPEQSRAAVSV